MSTFVCSYCGKRWGDPGTVLDSHGICTVCAPLVEAQLEISRFIDKSGFPKGLARAYSLISASIERRKQEVASYGTEKREQGS